jgi:hypothetical protein
MSRGVTATAPARAAVERRVQAVTARLDPVERPLWVAAAALAGLDVWLTVYGLRSGLAEGNPVVALLLAEVGVLAFVVVKGGALGLAASVRWVRPRWGPWLALGLALPWLLAVAINGVLLAT